MRVLGWNFKTVKPAFSILMSHSTDFLIQAHIPSIKCNVLFDICVGYNRVFIYLIYIKKKKKYIYIYIYIIYIYIYIYIIYIYNAGQKKRIGTIFALKKKKKTSTQIYHSHSYFPPSFAGLTAPSEGRSHGATYKSPPLYRCSH